MRETPECLNRRYQALDSLIKELSSAVSNKSSEEDYQTDPAEDPSVKLMCDFWNILQEDPDCDLSKVVRQRMGLNAKASKIFRPQRVTCYMACSHDDNSSKKDSKSSSPKHSCEKAPEPPKAQKSPERTCCSSRTVSPKSSIKSDSLPLSKVLCNLKEAVSFDKKCNIRIGELLLAEKQLQDQIAHLEHREKEGMAMLKQADCMWSCMEEAYKKKVAESQERQNVLLKQLKEVEASNTKWRKNKKDLEFQCDNINKCFYEIKEKMHEKNNDVKCIKIEIANTKKRIESNKKDTEVVKKTFSNKKTVSDAKIASLSSEITRIKKAIDEEKNYKIEKETEGNDYVKDARNDLQKICRVLLQKRLENEDLKAEKDAVQDEIEILNQTTEQCKEKCRSKQQAVIDELAKIDGDIANFKVRCTRCHECTDTADVRKFCTDCPRCAAERDCMYEDGHCMLDSTQDCVCMTTKQKFLDNVFDNMYTVLERQSKTCPGKAVAQAVLECLKRSRNGKLNEETRKILQDFVLTTVKKNLNLTIIGGAVKTRCEMDPETYKQLMLCLKQVKTVKAPKVDKGTEAKKDPCRRWGGTSECNCPKGPKACICTKKAPPPPNDPQPCPPEVDKEDAGETTVCPHKDSVACGADCALHGPSQVGTEVASWRPAPCDEKNCQFSKNMRAAQCVLGPDSLSSVSKSKGQLSATPILPDIMEFEDQITCKCGPKIKKPCSCRKDKKHLKAAVDYCDKGTCSMIWDQAIASFEENKNKGHKHVNDKPEKDNQPKTSKTSLTRRKKEKTELEIEKSTPIEVPKVESKEKYTSTKLHKKTPKKTDSKRPCLDNKNVKFGAHSESQTDQRNCSCEDNFTVSIENESSKLTKLTNTPSGSLAMELDEEIIKQIEQKMQGSSNIAVALKRTVSGHLEVDFRPDISSKNIRKINVNRSASGALVFEVDKKFVDVLKPDINIHKNNLELDNKPSVSVSITAKKHEEKESVTDARISKKVSKHKKHTCDTKHIEKGPPFDETRRNEDSKMKDLLKMKEINGTLIRVEADVTRTESGNLVFLITKPASMGLFGEVIDKCQQHPVQLSLSPSGSNLLDLQSATPNATMTKTQSDKIRIVKVDSVLRTTETKKTCCEQKKRNIFKVGIKDGKRKIQNLPVVLKATGSGNYIAIIDKEYESHYRETVKDNLNDDYECPVQLAKTSSSNYLLHIDDNNKTTTDNNAFIVRSHSGNIKILTDTDATSGRIKRGSSRVFESMLHNIPKCSKMESPTPSKEKRKIVETKSSSDSNIYEKVRLRLQNQQNLLSEPSALLKKTSSGQYSVVLNKESKKTFVNNLKTYLTKNSKGMIPIKRTESGEITIVLNNESESKGQYGTLKITPSGNIYVLVNEKVIRSMAKTGKTGTDDSNSQNQMTAVENEANKEVATTCNAFPDSCTCDPTKCVCAELLNHGVNDSYYNSSKCCVKYCEPTDSCQDQCQMKCKYKCDCGTCPENCDIIRFDMKSPHIVIKPCNCPSKPKKVTKGSRPTYYVTDTICPIHKDRYDSVSNELLEISSACNKIGFKNVDETQNVTEVSTKKRNKRHLVPFSLDYLDDMPPQLPHFLKDFRCS